MEISRRMILPQRFGSMSGGKSIDLCVLSSMVARHFRTQCRAVTVA